jgi:ribonuclease T
MSNNQNKSPIANRFRGFLPVVVDVETGGFNHKTDALLEIAAVTLGMDAGGDIHRKETVHCHVEPFVGANIEQASLDITGIDPYHPFRMAHQESVALEKVFAMIRREVKASGCSRAILVGHNPTFDLNFLQAAVDRTKTKRNPFHNFSTFDTATLSGLAYGQTVLARGVQAAGLTWDDSNAHSAIYDAERTADLFCTIVNRWDTLSKTFGDLSFQME